MRCGSQHNKRVKNILGKVVRPTSKTETITFRVKGVKLILLFYYLKREILKKKLEGLELKREQLF